MHCCWSFHLGHLSRLVSFPSPMSSLQPRNSDRQLYPHSLAQFVSLFIQNLPIEEGLSTITMEPSSIVKLKIMAISVPGVNLFNIITDN